MGFDHMFVLLLTHTYKYCMYAMKLCFENFNYDIYFDLVSLRFVFIRDEVDLLVCGFIAAQGHAYLSTI